MKTAFMTEVSSSIDNNKGKNKSISTVSSPTHKTKTELMESIKIETKNINIKTKSQYIEEDQKIISDLEDEI